MNIYVVKNGQRQGPFTIEEINSKLSERAFTASDSAWMQGWTDWQPLSLVPGVILPQMPPPVPVSLSSPPPPPPQSGKANIASLDVLPLWKERFQIMERIGWGQGMLKQYKNCMSLPLADRFTIGFNIWGFLFGPFYYFAKGMWEKGAIIIGAAIVLAALGGLPVFLVPAYCAGFANYDFYLFKVHGKHLW